MMATEPKKKPSAYLGIAVVFGGAILLSNFFGQGHSSPPPGVQTPPDSAIVPTPKSQKSGPSPAELAETKAYENAPIVGSDYLDNAGRRAEAEARKLLQPCQQPDQSLQGICKSNQYNFVVSYVRAKAGDLSGMTSIASSFQPPMPDAADYIVHMSLGLPALPLQSCAWLIVYARAPLKDYEARETPYLRQVFRNGRIEWANSYCGKLPADDAFAARRRAEVLLQELQTAPAKLPPVGWNPDYHGKPYVPKPIDRRCLMTTAEALTADPGKPVDPPPGCPR